MDIIVIGAGIHGAGVAQAAAAAGYSVVVIEKDHIASGTSSKSSKLIHGGLRYLESFQFSLVRKSLKERDVLCRIAPSLVKLKPFYIPVYKTTIRRPYKIRAGLSLYALLGGLKTHDFFKKVSRKKVKGLDGINKTDLQKVYRYYDGQTNDKKLTQAVMKSAVKLGANLICPANITSIRKNENNFIVNYIENNTSKKIESKVIVNASGPWVNEVNYLVNLKTDILKVDLVQGTHIIIDAPAPSGIYYLEANDERAIFVMPYEIDSTIKTLVGTTEKLFTGKADAVQATQEEIDYLLQNYQTYFPDNRNASVIGHFAGLRVLPITEGNLFSRPRDTVLHWVTPNFLALYGGKLTAYRSTSELVIKKIKPLLTKKRRVAYTDQILLY